MKPQTEKKLDEAFSHNVRMNAADKNGIVTCFTCGHTMLWKDAQLGHFRGRRNKSTRWHKDNCRVQCKTCNEFKEGMYQEFQDRLIRQIGQTRVDSIVALSNTVVKISEPEAQAMLQKLVQENKELQKKFI